MTFLNPYMLFALFAVAIPILLHLFNLKKVRKVEFSTLMFLKDIQKSKLRKIKFKQLLLLFLRIFLIIFIVLTFTNPVFKGYNFANADIKKSGIILLDDSYSMNTKDAKGTYFEQSKKIAEEIIKLYSSTDKVYIIPNSYQGMKDKNILDAFSPGIIDSINALRTCDFPFSLTRLLKITDDLIGNESSMQTEIFIISDFQKINFDYYSNLQYNKLNKNNIYFYAVNIGTREANNISIEKVIFKTKLFQKNKKINISARIRNFNKSSVSNKLIYLYADGNKLSESAVDIPLSESKDADFSFRINRTGNITGYVELMQNDFTDDEISEDNKYYFSFYIPDVFHILLVSDNPSNANYIRTAIETASLNEKDSLKTSYERYVYTENKNITPDLKNTDMMFISGKKSFSEDEIKLVEEFIKEGKGIFIFPDKNIEINSYNSLLTKLNSFRLNGIIVPAEVTPANLKFEKIDFEHPLISGIFKNENLSITSEINVESPEIKSYFDISSNEKSYPVISLSSGKPYLIEAGSSNGKIVLCAVSAENDMSNFPLNSLFAPLVIRGIEYLSNNGIEQNNNTIGNNNLVFLKGIKNISNVILPDKRKVPFNLNSDFKKENNYYNTVLIPYYSFTNQAGIYTFQDSSGNANFSFVLNYDTLESNMTKADKSEVNDYFNKAGIRNTRNVNGFDDIKTEVLQNRNGSELWKFCLLIAFALLIAEMIYSKRLEKL